MEVLSMVVKNTKRKSYVNCDTQNAVTHIYSDRAAFSNMLRKALAAFHVEINQS
jgi:hypothetical protein